MATPRKTRAKPTKTASATVKPTPLVDRVVRVDHAGEYGAKRIYEGQLAVLRRRGSASIGEITEMAEQELHHLQAFEKLMIERRVRPTMLFPIWHVAGFALGAASALMGDKAAMACTIAVEEVIEQHYADQLAELGPEEGALKEKIDEFRRDEGHHRETAEEHGGREAVGYPVMSAGVKAASRLAIWLSERI